MKNIVKLSVELLIVLSFLSCTKYEKTSPNNLLSNNFSKLERSFHLLSDVVDSLNYHGFTKVNPADDFPYIFNSQSGIVDFQLYKNSNTGKIVAIYIWDDIDLMFEVLDNDPCECYHIYYSDNEDCKNDGEECQVTIEDGEAITHLCTLKIENPPA